MATVKNSVKKYPLAIRILHWLMAVIIIALICIGWWMTGLPKEDPIRMDVYNLHKSFGVTLLALVAIRLLIRLWSAIPQMPKGIPVVIQWLAKAGHLTLYALMFIVPILGYIMSNSFGHPVNWFGVELPKLFSDDAEAGKSANTWHAYLAYTLLAVFLIHAAAALKHRFFDKPENDVLNRMM